MFDYHIYKGSDGSPCTGVYEFHSRYLKAIEGLREQYPNQVDGYYDPEFLRALLPYLPVPLIKGQSGVVCRLCWGFEPDYTRAPYYLPKLMEAYSPGYCPEGPSPTFCFYSEEGWMRFAEKHLDPRTYVEQVLLYYDKHGRYFKAETPQSALSAYALPDSYAGEFSGDIVYNKGIDEEYNKMYMQNIAEAAKRAAAAVEEETTSLSRARGLLKCVELAVGNGDWTTVINSEVYGVFLMDTVYAMLQECFDILAKRAPDLGYSLPVLRYEDSWNRISSFAEALTVCTHYMMDVKELARIEAEEHTGASRSSLKAMNLF